MRSLILCSYSLLAVIFWLLALGPGGGGTSEVEVGWPGAVLNGLAVIPLWRGHSWPVPYLSVGTLALAVGIASGGLPPAGPTFGALAGLAVLMVILLCVLGRTSQDVRGDLRPS
jgi:hypothetical protein